MQESVQNTLKFLVGRPKDWHLQRPSVPRMKLSTSWLGPLVVIGSVLGSWPAFAGAQGDEGSVALGLWVGAVSILLMAWSFVLALRLKFLEPVFGGLDSMYRVHRWAGTLAIVFMFLHTSIEPEIEGGIPGAAKSIADSAEDLAGTGEIMLYVLVALSLARIFPYRIWRLTHKLLGVPYAFACWHFFTASKPYANGSAWGMWFGGAMVVGLVAYVLRVVGMDMFRRGRIYKVVRAEHRGSTTNIELAPLGKPIGQKLGQFCFIKLDVDRMSEPHPFTIASDPAKPNLEFFIRHLGDWSSKLPMTDLVGKTVRVEGPYGQFDPIGDASENGPVWIAGGVGITPFLAALDETLHADRASGAATPTLFYAVRDIEDNPIVARLSEAADLGRLDLHLFQSGHRRLESSALDEVFPNGLQGRHVALCGPTSLVNSMAAAAANIDAGHIETEDFDIRQGFGPERSVEIDDLVTRTVRQRT